jgi:hypothetical protein
MTETTTTRERPPRWRRITGVALIVLGALLAPVAVVGNLAVVEFTNTNAFVDTFAPLARDPEVQTLVTTAVSDAIIQRVDIPALTAPVFDNLGLTLGPTASAGVSALGDVVTVAINNVVTATVERFVASDAFATVWETALRVSHKQLIAALSGDGGTVVSVQDGIVGIQLGPIVEAAKTALVDQGLGFASRIPEVDRTIVVVKSDSLAQAQAAYALAVGIAGWLPWIALLLLVGGVLLAGGSVLSMVFTASGVALAMALLLIGLAVGRAIVIREIVAVDLPRGVAERVFDQVLGSMYTTAVSVLVLALVVAVLIWLAQRFEVVRRLRERFQPATEPSA